MGRWGGGVRRGWGRVWVGWGVGCGWVGGGRVGGGGQVRVVLRGLARGFRGVRRLLSSPAAHAAAGGEGGVPAGGGPAGGGPTGGGGLAGGGLVERLAAMTVGVRQRHLLE